MGGNAVDVTEAGECFCVKSSNVISSCRCFEEEKIVLKMRATHAARLFKVID